MSKVTKYGISEREQKLAELAADKFLSCCLGESYIKQFEEDLQHHYQNLEKAISKLRGGKVETDITKRVDVLHDYLRNALSNLYADDVTRGDIKILKVAAAAEAAIEAKYVAEEKQQETLRAERIQGALERLDGGCVTQNDIQVIKAAIAGRDVLDVEIATTQDKQQHSLSDYMSSINAMQKNGAAKDADVPDTSIARKDGRDR